MMVAVDRKLHRNIYQKLKNKIMKQLRTLAILLSAIVAFSSCEEEEDQSKEALLTGKNWKKSAEVISPAIEIEEGVFITDFYQQYEDCYKDNTIKFNTNGTGAEDEGSTKCSSSDPQTIPGQWVFNSDKTVITISNQSEIQSLAIEELTKKTLKVKPTENIGGINYTLTTTYTAQ
jgi:hypothetical protein